MSDTSERNYDPTPQRKRQAHQEGRFPRSRELSGVAVILVGCLLLSFHGSAVFAELGRLVSKQLGSVQTRIDAFEPTAAADAKQLAMSRWLPFAAALLFVGVASQLAQGGFVWVPQRVVPDISRLAKGRVEIRWLAVAGLLLKLVTVGIVAAVIFRMRIFSWSAANSVELCGPSATTDALIRSAFCVLAALGLVAAVNYAGSIWRYHQSLRMTADELREESRGRISGMTIREAMATRDKPK